MSATRCCSHPKKKHRRAGFKPCTAPGCTCVSYWQQHDLAGGKPKATTAPTTPAQLFTA